MVLVVGQHSRTMRVGRLCNRTKHMFEALRSANCSRRRRNRARRVDSIVTGLFGPGSQSMTLPSCLFPERQADRVYGLQESPLSALYTVVQGVIFVSTTFFEVSGNSRNFSPQHTTTTIQVGMCRANYTLLWQCPPARTSQKRGRLLEMRMCKHNCIRQAKNRTNENYPLYHSKA
jgi:hypothetical protein